MTKITQKEIEEEFSKMVKEYNLTTENLKCPTTEEFEEWGNDRHIQNYADIRGI